MPLLRCDLDGSYIETVVDLSAQVRHGAAARSRSPSSAAPERVQGPRGPQCPEVVHGNELLLLMLARARPTAG